MIKLYGRRTSINVQKVLWALTELDLEFEWFDPDGVFGTIDVPGYDALNPNMRVPTLDDDGLILRQSNAIVRHLCRTRSKGDLYPTNEPELAEAEVWMDWQITEVQTTITPVFWALVRTPPETWDLDAIKAGTVKLNATFEIMEAMIGARDYVAGPRFTMGDIPVGAAVYRYMNMDIERPSLPRVEAYFERMKERPAYQTAIMIPLA
ncbi:MAG: glutathione S-transferase N-terminal domain-containing protein [Rhodospirillales bacterium]|nr:glutathione S-transferase N-terminal domain-containing protein [Rhodospirillales bacterium]